jgi:hypothetical protein
VLDQVSLCDGDSWNLREKGREVANLAQRRGGEASSCWNQASTAHVDLVDNRQGMPSIKRHTLVHLLSSSMFNPVALCALHTLHKAVALFTGVCV